MSRLAVSLSAYKELGLIHSRELLERVGSAIFDLVEDPFMPGTLDLDNNPGIRYVGIEDTYILYCVAEPKEADESREIIILGVLNGYYHPLH